jgi:hypothetical protein
MSRRHPSCQRGRDISDNESIRSFNLRRSGVSFRRRGWPLGLSGASLGGRAREAAVVRCSVSSRRAVRAVGVSRTAIRAGAAHQPSATEQNCSTNTPGCSTDACLVGAPDRSQCPTRACPTSEAGRTCANWRRSGGGSGGSFGPSANTCRSKYQPEHGVGRGVECARRRYDRAQDHCEPALHLARGLGQQTYPEASGL